MASVLVIDDETIIASMVSEVLREEGYDVFTASNGLQGLAWVRNFKPDVVISDLMMPGLDGQGLAVRMQRDPLLQSIPLVLMSAATPASMEGIAVLIRKPFNLDVLPAVVARMLDASQKEGRS